MTLTIWPRAHDRCTDARAVRALDTGTDDTQVRIYGQGYPGQATA